MWNISNQKMRPPPLKRAPSITTVVKVSASEIQYWVSSASISIVVTWKCNKMPIGGLKKKHPSSILQIQKTYKQRQKKKTSIRKPFQSPFRPNCSTLAIENSSMPWTHPTYEASTETYSGRSIQRCQSRFPIRKTPHFSFFHFTTNTAKKVRFEVN